MTRRLNLIFETTWWLIRLCGSWYRRCFSYTSSFGFDINSYLKSPFGDDNDDEEDWNTFILKLGHWKTVEKNTFIIFRISVRKTLWVGVINLLQTVTTITKISNVFWLQLLYIAKYVCSNKIDSIFILQNARRPWNIVSGHW